jgi:hypothetical protein
VFSIIYLFRGDPELLLPHGSLQAQKTLLNVSCRTIVFVIPKERKVFAGQEQGA